MGMTFRNSHKAVWDLTLRLLDTPPPPCIKPKKCIHYDKCAREKLACATFRRYVATKSYVNYHGIHTPSRRIYKDAMLA